MFHTFESRSVGESATATLKPSHSKVKRSCFECTRRKVKCNGGHPCTSCQYYRIPETCIYKQRSKRQNASRSALEKATETLRRQAGVLEQIFPNHCLDDLVEKERSELVRLFLHEYSGDENSQLQTLLPPVSVSPAASEPLEDAHDSPKYSENGEPREERHWDEVPQDPATTAASDDINAISLARDRHRRSFLGIGSVSAVLSVLFHLCPAAKEHSIKQSRIWTEIQKTVPRSSTLDSTFSIPPASDSLQEQRYIGFYFENLHAITPFLHEDSFRAKFAAGDRQTPGWLGLCNMVLTLGSIASGSDTAHIHYYNKARSYLDLDSLSSGNLETLQALCLLGGYYLHYRNSPNMAYAILGAAQRLAIASGLHRESQERNDHRDPETNQSSNIRAECRRRTWWSLYCLDTWASMTLGRPTCGRWDSSTMTTLLPTALDSRDHLAISLGASCQFCHICNRVQHRFAQTTDITINEAQHFDRELQEWYTSLPSMLRDTTDTPPRIVVAREFLRNRYHNVRLLLSRCFLLYLTYENRNRHRPSTPAEQQMVQLCRTISAEAIDAIALHWVPNRIQVWNSAWYLFQACMVPLLSIAMGADSNPGGVGPSDTVLSYHASLNRALETFAEMKPWMRAFDRAPDIVAVLFQAVSQEASRSGPTQSVVNEGPELFGWADEQFTEMDWSMFFGDENISHDSFLLN